MKFPENTKVEVCGRTGEVAPVGFERDGMTFVRFFEQTRAGNTDKFEWVWSSQVRRA